jgi:hypothetical protein
MGGGGKSRQLGQNSGAAVGEAASGQDPEGQPMPVTTARVNLAKFALASAAGKHIMADMKLGSTLAADWEAEFGQLVRSADWRQLAKVPMVMGAFNVFDVLNEAVCENSWSRILAALFTSSGNHNLDILPLKTWLSVAGDSRFKALARQVAASSALCEWVTMERRRLDILIKLLDRRGHLIGVVGIENKVWSAEQSEQLSDYQNALCKSFPRVPKILLFLTPGEREPRSSVPSRSCPCRPCSYKTIVSMCDSLISSASRQTRLLLATLRDFVDRNILSDGIMKTKVEQMVRNLYLNKGHRDVLEAIFENRPTLEAVRLHLEKTALDSLARMKADAKCVCDQWPTKAANPQEIRVRPESLEKAGFGISYMFRSKAHHPFIGDSFTMLIAAWCQSAAARRRVKSLAVRLPEQLSHNFRSWAGWEIIWEGDTYELEDLNGRDAKNLSQMLKKTISKTFRPLNLAVAKL